jgi:cobalt-zinc-cadmium efflux system protein
MHQHDQHAHHGHHHHPGTGNLTVAFWLNTGFALLEIAGGLYTNSVAILSDALHDLGDSLSLGTAWYFQKKSGKRKDETYTYGYQRFSILGAFINSMVLIIGSLFIIREAVERLGNPEQPDAKGMLVFAVIGIIVNGLALFRLRKGGSINERMVSLHFLEDVLGWIAVLIGSIIMMFYHVPILDPLLSLGIALFILFNVFRNIRSAFQIILQGVPENISEPVIRKKLESYTEIESIHDVHVWSMEENYNILTMHAVVRENTTLGDLEQLKDRIKKELRELNIQHATVEFELSGFECKHLHVET